MRTTIDIDDDILAAVKEQAKRTGNTAGHVLSAIARQALTQAPAHMRRVCEPEGFYGFRPFPAGGQIVTNELINRIRDAEGI